MAADPTPHIVIAGGGAGGLELAIRLARATRRGRRARVTLVDPSPVHLWKPRLHEIAVGLLVAADEQARYAEQATMHGFAFVLGPVEAVDAKRRTLRIGAVAAPDEGGELLPVRTLAFDTAVIAIGSTINDFGISGVCEHCHALDTAGGAERLHGAIMAQAARVAAGYGDRLCLAIVGAGTTGTELAADLSSASGRMALYRSLIAPDQLDVILIEEADRPLPAGATDSSDYARELLAESGVATRFGAEVSKVEAGCLHLKDGGTVAADILVWASGVRGRDIEVTPPPRMEKGGRMHVDARLRLIGGNGKTLDHVYAIGDCAACFAEGEDKPVGATAQAAQQQARLLARSLARQLRGKPALRFRFHYRGTLVSLGAGRAVGTIPAGSTSFRIAGVTAKLAYGWLYREHLLTLFGLARTAAMTLARRLRRSAAPSVKLHW